MRIVVKTADTNLNLPIPTWLVVNPLTAALVYRVLRKYGFPVSSHHIRVFVKELQRFRRRYGGWTLVEVHSHDGEYINIQL